MAATLTMVAAGQNYACDGVADQLNAGKIKIKSAADVLLVTLIFGNPAFGNAGASVDGRAEANAITDGVAVATGTATKATVHKSDDTQLFECNVATSGATINMDSVSIVSGQTYGLSSFNLTMPTACGA
jgi:hypothetical protein